MKLTSILLLGHRIATASEKGTVIRYWSLSKSMVIFTSVDVINYIVLIMLMLMMVVKTILRLCSECSPATTVRSCTSCAAAWREPPPSSPSPSHLVALSLLAAATLRPFMSSGSWKFLPELWELIIWTIFFKVGRGSRNWGTSSGWEPPAGGIMEKAAKDENKSSFVQWHLVWCQYQYKYQYQNEWNIPI